jgi:hypothetical protein
MTLRQGHHAGDNVRNQSLRQLPRAEGGLYGMNTTYASHLVENLPIKQAQAFLVGPKRENLSRVLITFIFYKQL